MVWKIFLAIVITVTAAMFAITAFALPRAGLFIVSVLVCVISVLLVLLCNYHEKVRNVVLSVKCRLHYLEDSENKDT